MIATGHELSVEVSSVEPDWHSLNFFVHIAMSYSMRQRGCFALLNVNDSIWLVAATGMHNSERSMGAY